MSLDVSLQVMKPVAVFESNITHNLNVMAAAVSQEFYMALWRPEEGGLDRAYQLVEPLREGLAKLKANPENFKQHNPTNGWGDYDGLVRFAEAYLAACEENPNAVVVAGR